jgi:succinoglycan biosynthesis transport protein ExoP
MEIKLHCECGQRYKFDVEPVNGRMPGPVRCPACGLDGTAKANDILRQSYSGSPARQSYMQEKHKGAASGPGHSINLADIYHVLFRHKWKILVVWAVGIVAALGLREFWPLPYASEAKLYVRYVQDTKPINVQNANGPDPSYMSASSGADSVINTEVEILTSLDVARETAEALPPDILSKLNAGTNSYVIASVIRAGLDVETGARNPVMHVFFKHKDPTVVQAVLSQAIESYFKKYRSVHQVGGVQDDNLTMTTDQLKAQLTQTEEDLRKIKEQVDVTSLPETKKDNAEALAKIREDLWSAETELEEHRAVLNSMTNGASLTSVKSDTNAPAPAPLPDGKLAEYKEIRGTLDTLQKRKADLRLLFTEKNSRVQAVQDQIDQNQKLKSQLEAEYPQLTSYQIPSVSPSSPSGVPTLDLAAEKAKLVAIQIKIARLKDHEKETKAQIDKVSTAEAKIEELERLRDTQQANLATFERKHFESRIEDELNDGKLSSIKIIQQPSLPFKDSTKLNKLVLMVFFGSIAAGLALAFVIEFYIDRSFKRPIEIETKLGLPLFLSIPETSSNGKSLLSLPKVRLLAASNGSGKNGNHTSTAPAESEMLPPWKPNSEMQPFFEALRDRLVTHFEVNEINHKPKLVAVTSCAEGSGVSTVATGLAASLSETGEGNVLLVDMNLQNGSAHFFHKGKLSCGLDEILENEAGRENAQVEKNLFVVSENTSNTDDKLPRILHKRFSALIPKLHASDFDYIIFDMPPISQTSATTRVARFMDMVFMVVEAERTESEVVKRASKMLTEAKAGNVGVVLNKSHNYVPRRLLQEL